MNKNLMTQLRFTKRSYDVLQSTLLADRNEKHAFAFGRLVEGKDRDVVLLDKIVTFDTDEIDISPVSVKIDKELAHAVFVRFVNSEYDVMISCHSHPFEQGKVWFSAIDDTNDMRLFEYFYDEIVKYKLSGRLYTMVFGQHTVAARGFELKKRRMRPIEEVRIVDAPIRTVIPTNAKQAFAGIDETYHRQTLAFGEEGQRRLSKMKVALIGAGGTGSILAESLVRLGVKDLVIVDDDTLETTNLNRWQGAECRDVGKSKVKLLKRRIKRIDRKVRVRAYSATLFNRDIVDTIKDSDIIIGAVDSDKARYVLNRIAQCYLIPYLDCSSGIVSDEGAIKRLATRNVVVIPGVSECMVCSDRYIDRSKLQYEFVSSSMRTELERRKYIDDAQITSPSVYPLNMLSVSLLMLELINLVFAYKTPYGNNYVDYMHTSEAYPISWGIDAPSAQCFECNDRLALGDDERVWELFEEG